MRALLAVALALATGACKERERSAEPPSRTPPPVTAAEKQRGVAACADYKSRVCACARSSRPDLAGQCRMADTRIDALELSLKMADAERDTGKADSNKALAISNARKVMRQCIEQVAELAGGCAGFTGGPAKPEAPTPPPPAGE